MLLLQSLTSFMRCSIFFAQELVAFILVWHCGLVTIIRQLRSSEQMRVGEWNCTFMMMIVGEWNCLAIDEKSKYKCIRMKKEYLTEQHGVIL